MEIKLSIQRCVSISISFLVAKKHLENSLDLINSAILMFVFWRCKTLSFLEIGPGKFFMSKSFLNKLSRKLEYYRIKNVSSGQSDFFPKNTSALDGPGCGLRLYSFKFYHTRSCAF
jgi:hypothetical protein